MTVWGVGPVSGETAVYADSTTAAQRNSADRPNRRDFVPVEVEDALDFQPDDQKSKPGKLVPTPIMEATRGPSEGWAAYFRNSWREVFLSTKLNLLLPFMVLAMVAKSSGWSDAWVFTFALAALCPLAERLGFCTEQIAMYTNPTLGGLLNATFGNVTEMIVAVYALQAGKLRVVQLSLLGSILSNMLLVLGCAFFFGGLKYSTQTFNKEGSFASCGLLLVGVLGLMLPNMLHATHTELHGTADALTLSRFIACLMLIMYFAYLVFQLYTHKHLYDEEEDDDEEEEVPVLGFWGSMFWLGVFTILVSILSDYLVDTIDGAASEWGIPLPFVSTILLPIVGNAAEHAASVLFAMKNKMNISLGVAIGSSAQITILVIPFCVVLGWAINVPLGLNMHEFETAVMFVSVVIVAVFLQDGNSNWLKGLVLILSYVALAGAFYNHSDAELMKMQVQAPAPAVAGGKSL